MVSSYYALSFKTFALYYELITLETHVLACTHSKITPLRRHEAKALGNRALRWFVRFKFVVGVHFTLGASVVVLLLFVLPWMLYLFFLSPAFSTQGTSMYSTTRCDWWYIPGICMCFVC
jgi:hypothetical protein